MLLLVGACAGPASSAATSAKSAVVTPTVASTTQCADVIAVDTFSDGDGTMTFSVTVRSDDTGWDGYADRWEVVVNGEVAAERVLTHPHVNEQPFTRSRSGILLAADEVLVRAHHSVGGFCGTNMVVPIG